MTDLDLEAIKARAEAATRMTGGLPWEVVNDVMVSAIERNPRDGSVESGGNVACTHNSNLSAHIAGMDPETTLALVEEIERLRAENLEHMRRKEAGKALAAFQERRLMAWMEGIATKRDESEDGTK